MLRNVLLAAILCPPFAATAAEYMEKTPFQLSRAFSPGVVTEGGRIVWVAGQTATRGWVSSAPSARSASAASTMRLRTSTVWYLYQTLVKLPRTGLALLGLPLGRARVVG